MLNIQLLSPKLTVIKNEKEETKKEKEMEKGKEEKDEFEANRTSWTSWLYETIHFLLCLPSDILTNTN